MTNKRKTILVMGEHLTPSHVVRPMQLAKALSEYRDCSEYIVHFATSEVPPGELAIPRERFHRVVSPEASLLARRVNRVLFPLYTQRDIAEMVDSERRLIELIQPDLIIHDFRNTLAITAQITRTPVISLNDFYWNEAYPDTHIMPDTPLRHLLGRERARKFSKLLAPVVEAAHTAPFNKVARTYRVEQFRNLRHLYNTGHAQWLFDVPEMLPMATGSRTQFLGPLLWESIADVPQALRDMKDNSAICITFSSSGSRQTVEKMLDTIDTQKMPVIVLTAGKYTLRPRPGVLVADFIPLCAALSKSRVFICHGGSSLVYHSVKACVPVIGVPQNITQWYSMHRFVELGIGTLLPPELARGKTLQKAINLHCDGVDTTTRMETFRRSLVAHNPLERVGRLVEAWVHGETEI